MNRYTTSITEWSVCEDAFHVIVKLWNAPSVDLFASRLNHKVNMYISWEPDPHSCVIDVISCGWGFLGLCYAFPPFNLMTRFSQAKT